MKSHLAWREGVQTSPKFYFPGTRTGGSGKLYIHFSCEIYFLYRFLPAHKNYGSVHAAAVMS